MDRAARSDLALTPWYGPTLEQFVVYAERAFGGLGLRSAGPGNRERTDTSLHEANVLTGLRAGERPSPAVLRRLCSQWGLPPEDFGLEPD